MTNSGVAQPGAAEGKSGFRWLQLAMGIVCMAMIANLQYGWTLFVDPIDAKYHWGRAAIQLAFALFVVAETWLVPVEAWFVDKYGPSVVVCFGGVMVALAWVFVASRILHSLIHTGSNIVMQRGGAFMIGFVAVALMWLWFGLRLYVIG